MKFALKRQLLAALALICLAPTVHAMDVQCGTQKRFRGDSSRTISQYMTQDLGAVKRECEAEAREDLEAKLADFAGKCADVRGSMTELKRYATSDISIVDRNKPMRGHYIVASETAEVQCDCAETR